MSPSDKTPDGPADEQDDATRDEATQDEASQDAIAEQPDDADASADVIEKAAGPSDRRVDATEGAAYLESNRLEREKMRAREAKKEARSARVSKVTGRIPSVDWSKRGVVITLITVLGGLFIVTGGLSIWLWTQRSDLQQQVHDLKSAPNDQARVAVMDAARQGIVQFGTFQPDQLDDWDQRMRAVTTREFAQTQLAGGQLKQAISQVGASSKGEVLDVGIESMTSDNAVVIAFLNQNYRNPDILKLYPNGETYATRIKATMKLVDGHWLINSLDVVS